jgi:REP element-mobilizing transposase RayT
MPSHLHLIASAKENNLSTVVGSFKKYTSRELIKMVQQTHESRREWLLPIFKDAGEKNLRNKNYQVWLQDNHPVEVYSPKFTLSKIKYSR